jgi:dihydrolipoamide dehydrogenase
VVYTNPEMASVGLTEALARAQGIATRTLKLPMTYSGRFMAENEGVNGLCKVLIDPDSERVLGVHLLGNPAGELISTAALAIEHNLTVNELQKLIFPHPTVSEILKEVLYSENVSR